MARRMDSKTRGPTPYGFDSGLLGRLTGEEIEHVVAHPWSNAENPFELVRGGAIDGQPLVLQIGHLHERVRALDDVGEQLPFGKSLGDAPFKRLVQLT
jgi:hypothetical protein